MINRGKKRRNGSMRQLRKSFARGQMKIHPPQVQLIKEIESQRKVIEMNNDNPTTDEPSNQPGEPEPNTPSSSEINKESAGDGEGALTDESKSEK